MIRVPSVSGPAKKHRGSSTRMCSPEMSARFRAEQLTPLHRHAVGCPAALLELRVSHHAEAETKEVREALDAVGSTAFT